VHQIGDLQSPLKRPKDLIFCLFLRKIKSFSGDFIKLLQFLIFCKKTEHKLLIKLRKYGNIEFSMRVIKNHIKKYGLLVLVAGNYQITKLRE